MNVNIDAIVHLRVPAALKARWIRESRSHGMRLSDWLVEKVMKNAELESEQQRTAAKEETGKVAIAARQYILARTRNVGASVINDASIATSGLGVAKIKRDGSLLLNIPASQREATDAELCAIADCDAELALEEKDVELRNVLSEFLEK